tara:strand:- start:66 stop:704 length:639 start_codon:yes stop_codon:yes gene_type:complete
MNYLQSYSIDNRLSESAIDNLVTFLISKEQEILDSYPFMSDFGTSLTAEHVSTRSNAYNIFKYIDEYPDLNIIFEFIKTSYWNYIDNVFLPKNFTNDQLDPSVSAWLNVIRESETIGMHKHSDQHPSGLWSFVSGTISLGVSNTSTFYNDGSSTHEVKNAAGELTLFPPYFTHWTNIHTSSEPRVTLGFDVLFRHDHAPEGIDFTNNLKRFS